MSKKGKPFSQNDKRRLMSQEALRTGQPPKAGDFRTRVQHLVDTEASKSSPKGGKVK
jgi:hypothetical protein